jgi:hypothetical protein
MAELYALSACRAPGPARVRGRPGPMRGIRSSSRVPADRQQRCCHRPLRIGQIAPADNGYRVHEVAVR